MGHFSTGGSMLVSIVVLAANFERLGGRGGSMSSKYVEWIVLKEDFGCSVEGIVVDLCHSIKPYDCTCTAFRHRHK